MSEKIDYTEIRDGEIRGKICELLSEMLDNPDENGIYPTSRFMWKMESYCLQLKAERDELRKNVSMLRFNLGLVRTDVDTVYRALFQYDFHHGEAKKLGNILREIDSTFEQLKNQQPEDQGE